MHLFLKPLRGSKPAGEGSVDRSPVPAAGALYALHHFRNDNPSRPAGHTGSRETGGNVSC